ncbi:hypothetical protein A5881_002296 [Enterococcus termitis]|nr:hypothetical protein A5881_001384 [Enterococcus termitis]
MNNNLTIFSKQLACSLLPYIYHHDPEIDEKDNNQ